MPLQRSKASDDTVFEASLAELLSVLVTLLAMNLGFKANLTLCQVRFESFQWQGQSDGSPDTCSAPPPGPIGCAGA